MGYSAISRVLGVKPEIIYSWVKKASKANVGNTCIYLLAGAGVEGVVLHKHETRIAERLPAGAYTIEATTYSPRSGSDFTLTLGIAR